MMPVFENQLRLVGVHERDEPQGADGSASRGIGSCRPVTGTSVFDAWQAERAHLGELLLLPEPLRLGRDSTRDGGLSRVLRAAGSVEWGSRRCGPRSSCAVQVSGRSVGVRSHRMAGFPSRSRRGRAVLQAHAVLEGPRAAGSRGRGAARAPRGSRAVKARGRPPWQDTSACARQPTGAARIRETAADLQVPWLRRCP